MRRKNKLILTEEILFLENKGLRQEKSIVAEPKLFIFDSNSRSCHLGTVLPLKTVLYQYCSTGTIKIMSQWRFFFILASSKVQTNFNKYLFTANKIPAPVPGSRSQLISAPPAPTPAPQHWKNSINRLLL